MSEMINGYELLQPLQNQNAGFCKWTFVRRYGHEYFLKEFVDPVYPEENACHPSFVTSGSGSARIMKNPRKNSTGPSMRHRTAVR